MKIFIADDHAQVRNALRTLLNSQPEFSVCGEAENGKEAVEKAPDLKPDLIVLDISMPILGGLEATHNIRKVLPTVPIVLFTAYRTRFSEALAVASGANSIVSKDDHPHVLIQTARTLLHMDSQGE